jgi:AraC-like DNA-binding protein
LERLGVVGRRIVSAPTLCESIGRMTRELSRVSSEIDLVFESRRGAGWFRRDDRAPGYRTARAAEQFILSLMIEVVRRAAGTDWQPDCLLAYHALSENSVRRLGLENTKIRSGQRGTAISVPLELLPLPMAEALPAILKPLPSVDDGDVDCASLVVSLRLALAPLLGRHALNIEFGAELAHTNVRSLQRALSREGTTWSEILDELRFQKARTRIADPSACLAEVARDAGYSDHPHLTRAFVRWTGSSPTAYRRSLKR